MCNIHSLVALGAVVIYLSQGELYTLITNKSAHGKNGVLVAIVKGTDSSDVIRALMQIRRTQRNKVKVLEQENKVLHAEVIARDETIEMLHSNIQTKQAGHNQELAATKAGTLPRQQT